MKVLHVGKFFYPHKGGLEFYMRDTLVEFSRRGVECAALVHQHEAGAGDADEVFREGGAAVPRDADGTFVYEGPSSGAGETVNWDRAAALSKGRHMILAGGLDANNVARAIATVRPWGVDVSSGVESAPGEKDTGRIRNFISAARAAEKQ